MKSSIKCKLIVFLVCSSVLIVAAIIVSAPDRGIQRFNQIRHGATKAEVIHLVGRPPDSFTNILVALRFGGNEVWAYRKGSRVVEIADAIIFGKGLGKRLFLPETNDYIVVFDASGTVLRTLEPRPKQKM